ncbi:MAG: tetratricopeptide repeat protein [Deltaproteobacteria bacterium]|nr:tetratricopeptide repeat protein [Deltaproteobacteria bacterium]
MFNRLLRLLFFFPLALLIVSCGPSLKQKKEEASIHFKMGVVHFNDRNYSDSLKELTEAIEIYPEDPSYHNALGLAYFARGLNQDAIKHILAAIGLDVNYSEAHVNLSAVYLVEKDWDKAIAQAKEALKNVFYKTPHFAHYNLAAGYFNKGEYAKAVESYGNAVKIHPNYAAAHYEMGLAYERTNNTKAAVEAYEKAVRSAPAYIEAHYGLGVALSKMKNNAAAMKSFEKVIALAPDSDMAKSAKDYIELYRLR